MPHFPVKVASDPYNLPKTMPGTGPLKNADGAQALRPPAKAPELGAKPPTHEDAPPALTGESGHTAKVELRGNSEALFDPASLPEGLFSKRTRERLGDQPVSVSMVRKLLVNNTLTNTSKAPTLLGTTPNTGARVTLDRKGDAGDFLCSHIMRLNTELRTANPKLVSGFIHIPEHPNLAQTSEVVGMGVKGVADKFKDKSEVTVLLTGFTHFGSVTDNASGRFLFGDGTSDSLDSFGLREPKTDTADAMMEQQFGKPKSVAPMVRDGQTVGRSYTYDAGDGKTRTINLAFARLPVDDNLDATATGPNNPAGDGAGDILRDANSRLKPDAIISLGVGVYGQHEQDRYEVEVNAPGMSGGNYTGKPIPNPSLGAVYKDAFK